MPSASSDMIKKLATDAASVKAILAKLKADIAKLGESENEPAVTKLETAFGLINPQIEKFARDIDLKPPIFADEKPYGDRRKDLTGLTAVLAKVAKSVAAEVVAAKSEIIVEAVSAAESELVINDKKLAQALKAVARGDKGRAGPKEDGIKEYNHIHVGGNAKYNLLFQPGKKLVLGTIDFHIDSDNSKAQKEKVKKVAGRAGGKIKIAISGDTITLK